MNRHISISALFWIISVVVPLGAAAQNMVIQKQPGDFASPSRGCIAQARTSPDGGFLVLSVVQDGQVITAPVNDVTGFLWTSKSTLVFSVSPIYGKPGIFAFGCPKNGKKKVTISVLVKPTNISKAYPSGTDYFELSRLEGNSDLYFFYAEDVDKADFTTFRTKKNERLTILPNNQKFLDK